MPSVGSVATALVLLASSVQAHYKVSHPPTIQPFDDEGEGEGPCGGYTPDPANLNATDFHVDGDAIGTSLTHPEATWLYRITTDLSGGGNWTEAYPQFHQNGAGAYCIGNLTISHEYIGQTAIFGLVAKAPDGLLYQCSAVTFVEGTAPQPGDCKNGTGVTATYTTDSDLTSQLGNPSVSPDQHATSLGVSNKSDSFRGLGAMVTVGVMAILGAAMMV
ncbi:ferric-chelate reductase Frp1 [Hypoxylon texense]